MPHLRVIQGTGRTTGPDSGEKPVTAGGVLDAAFEYAIGWSSTEAVGHLQSEGFDCLIPKAVAQNPDRYPGFGFLVASLGFFKNREEAITSLFTHMPMGNASEAWAKSVFCASSEAASSEARLLDAGSIPGIVARAVKGG